MNYIIGLQYTITNTFYLESTTSTNNNNTTTTIITTHSLFALLLIMLNSETVIKAHHSCFKQTKQLCCSSLSHEGHKPSTRVATRYRSYHRYDKIEEVQHQECKQMILDEIQNRLRQAVFDSFNSHQHI